MGNLTGDEMAQLGRRIFAALGQMDGEADTVCDGHPTGLSWYAAHSRPGLKRPRTEPEWSKRLALLLSQRGIPAASETPSTVLMR